MNRACQAGDTPILVRKHPCEMLLTIAIPRKSLTLTFVYSPDKEYYITYILILENNIGILSQRQAMGWANAR
jgi:hypothetical protein